MLLHHDFDFMKNALTETTPDDITDELVDFCADVASSEPIYVTVKPMAGTVAGYCWQNVAMVVNRHAMTDPEVGRDAQIARKLIQQIGVLAQQLKGRYR